MAERLDHYLQAEEGAGRILAHAKLLGRITEIYARTAPPHLLAVSKLANFKSGLVVLHAENGAVAAKLRQLTPTLIDELTQRGIACRSVQIKVKACEHPLPARTASVRPLSPQVCRQLASLRDALPASPLRNALETLLTCAAKETLIYPPPA